MTIENVESAIRRAKAHDSLLDQSVLDMKGFSTGVMRRMISNLCEHALAYLEVGAYCGATACAAINNKQIETYIFEDFSQAFGDPDVRLQLERNMLDVRKTGGVCTCWFKNYLTHEHAFEIPPEIYFFDGEHSRESQAAALPWAFDRLAQRFLFIVDDSNWESVWHGTADGFKALEDKLNITHSWKLIGQQRQDDPVWWNGMALFLCEKL